MKTRTLSLLHILLAALMLMPGIGLSAKTQSAEPRLLVLTERGGQHEAFVSAALRWLADYAKQHRWQVDVVGDTRTINDTTLARYKVLLQLDYPPYNWTDAAQQAMEHAMRDGTMGWIGFHHASLLGDFDGFPMWQWASRFLGGIKFQGYVQETCDGRVVVEQPGHPIFKGVSREFTLPGDEWYTYDRSPRGQVQVLAHVDEDSYSTSTPVRMGDHPVVWTNERVRARNVYFQFGHDAQLLQSKDFCQMLSNAIEWASGPAKWFPRCHALVLHNKAVERAHRDFDEDAMAYFRELGVGDGIVFDFTSDFDALTYENLRTYDLLISLDDNPGHTPRQRAAFERYMENGGGWLGFHSAAFNIPSTGWPWFVQFLGGAVFNRNSWPPLPARLRNDAPDHPLMKGMPASYMAPENEWYQWEPSPRLNPDVQVLLSLDDSNYPLGLKDELPKGLDTPVAWTNTRYNMVYLNWGHGHRIFTDPTQNYLLYNCLRWLARKSYDRR